MNNVENYNSHMSNDSWVIVMPRCFLFSSTTLA